MIGWLRMPVFYLHPVNKMRPIAGAAFAAYRLPKGSIPLLDTSAERIPAQFA